MNRSKLVVLAASALAAALVCAEDLKSPFESLPAETFGAIRLDNSPGVLDDFVESTRVGQLLFSPQKIEDYKEFLESMIESEDQGGELVRKLNEVGLDMDDLYAMASSKIGGAVIDKEVPGQESMPTIFVWAEMSDGLAERVFNAVLEGSSESEKMERIDLDFPGGPGARIRDLTDGTSFLVSQLGNRFLFAIGYVTSVLEGPEAAGLYEEAELDALGRFMNAQLGDGGEFLSRFYDDPGVSSARPDFYSRIEALGDFGKLMELLPLDSKQIVEALDLEQFTKLGIWSGFVQSEEKSTLFLGAPRPRRGLARLLDNEVFEFAPPVWVPASVNSYSVSSFDMNKLFDFGVETARKFLPPEQVEQSIVLMDAQLQAMLQTDIATLMGSFGNRFHAVEYEFEMAAVQMPDGSSLEIPQASQALVVDFTRPDILEAGLAQMAPMLQSPGSGMQIIQEQGFKGVRMENPAQGSTITIAHGLGKLVMAIGSEDTASRIFSTLSNLPEGDEALANSPDFREYLAENRVRPAMIFSYTQGDKALKSLMPVLKSFWLGMMKQAGSDAEAIGSSLMDLLPSDEEMEGLLGIAFSRMFATEKGIVIEGSNQYK